MVPTWKKWLSYLAEIHLESAGSEYNPHLYVSLRRGRYQLSTANAIYSYDDLYANFYKTFERFDWAAYPAEDVLLLGLGLGSVPRMLERNFGRRFHLTAVEIDEVVVDLAWRYGLSDLENPIELVCTDAATFLAVRPDRYDLICMDVFSDEKVPAYFETDEFLTSLRDHLAPGGALLYNRMAASPEQLQESQQFYRQHFQPVFPDSQAIHVGYNLMLVSPGNVVSNPQFGGFGTVG